MPSRPVESSVEKALFGAPALTNFLGGPLVEA
jgi:hypothetical protein